MILEHQTYLNYKEETIQGRYVTNTHIDGFLKKSTFDSHVENIGYSVNKRPIRSIQIGKGNHKILIWSQMHGNESTTTKAVLDLMIFLASENTIASNILEKCTIKIIPILNPDGAEAYTRVNANQIDLNRDAQDQSQPESKVLREIYDDFQPDFCFNLHDQRTIFNVGNTDKPATVSFLAPSHDAERSISKTRGISMQLIATMNAELQQRIPGQIGRYDDGFNANCVGDTFQMLHTPTILFEAGHFHEDYEREETRAFIFYALTAALDCISENNIQAYEQDAYFLIPENKKLFFDVVIKNAQQLDTCYTKDIGILYVEVLKDGNITFEPSIEKIGCLESYYGHQTYDCKNDDHLSTLKKQDFWNLLKA
jgi:hypothetical protein